MISAYRAKHLGPNSVPSAFTPISVISPYYVPSCRTRSFVRTLRLASR